MKKMKWLIVPALLLVLVLSLALVGCGPKGEEVSQTEWNEAFEAKNFENVTMKVTQESDDGTMEMVAKAEEKKGSIKMSGLASDTDFGMGSAKVEMEVYACQEEDILYEYAKYKDSWIRYATDKIEEDEEEDSSMITDEFDFLKDMYEDLTYNKETGLYEGEDVDASYYMTYDKVEVKIVDKKVASIKFYSQNGVNSNYEVTEISFSNYGKTHVSLPRYDKTKTNEYLLREDASWYFDALDNAWERETKGVYNSTTYTYEKEDLFDDNQVGNDSLATFLEKGYVEGIKDTRYSWIDVNPKYVAPQNETAYVVMNPQGVQGVIVLSGNSKVVSIDGYVYQEVTNDEGETVAERITVETPMEEIEKACDTADFKIIVKDGKFTIA